MDKTDFGIIGMAVMGQNLALNVESKGFSVSVFNRTASKTEDFAKENTQGKNILPTYSLEEFVASLEKPRKVMLMVKAGEAVDDFIAKLLPHLDKGDIIIDGGNSFFGDTVRRAKALEEKGYLYIGTGVSGGEEGALHGPAIMPGGSEEAWSHLQDVLQKIAAKAPDGTPCCDYIGPDGAGHYVKMVHNGIEYGDMQLICEAYFIMKNVLQLSPEKMQQTFAQWNEGDLDSYLVEITANILSKKDPETSQPLVEVIMDKAKQKGTGKWTSQSALDLGVPAPTIAEAVFARCISGLKDERETASQELKGPEITFAGNKEEFIEAIHEALYASKICSYAQGFALMQAAAKEYSWSLDFGRISLLWRAGCIIRARFLERIKEAFDRNPNLPNLLMDPYFKDIILKAQPNWRKVVGICVNLGIPAPALCSALTYFDSYRNGRLPANLLQAQRDYFGAHTYERIDKEGSFHTEWLKI